ncbi:MAG: hypothetical protein ACR2J3_04220 [Aridibacter sp.]
MQQFNQLGEKIEEIWRDKNYDEEIFPSIAKKGLAEAELPEKVTAWEVMDWTLSQTNLPEQKDLPGRFGDPPITIYNSPRFHIDVYFWLEGTTSIHQHAFCGAFQVLHGSSIHSWYDFETSNKINTFTKVGEMKLKVCQILEVGDIQEIWAGTAYIHGLFHLEQPSATIVVRTHKSPLHLPQYNYHKPNFAIDPFFDEANTIKKLQCITALIRSKHPDTDKYIKDLLSKSDAQTTFQIISTVRGYLQHNQIDKMFNLDTPKNRLEEFFGVIRKRHGDFADVLIKTFQYQERIGEIINRRNYITEPEHRFFLALLMNVEGKELIFSLVKEKFPEADPLDKILDWVYDLSQTRVLGLNVPNALGIENFDDFDLFILECFLKDMSDNELEEALRAEYPSENAEELLKNIEARKEKIRNALIFYPLLHNSEQSLPANKREKTRKEEKEFAKVK